MRALASHNHIDFIGIFKGNSFFMDFAKFNLERFHLDFWHRIDNNFDNVGHFSVLIADKSKENFFFLWF